MAGEQQQQGNDNSLGPLWMVLAIIIAIAGVWYLGHAYISMVVLKIKLGEAYLISLFTSKVHPIIEWIKKADPYAIKFETLQSLSTAVGEFLAYPIAAILCALAVLLYLSSAPLRFRKTYSMRDLLDAEHVNWPQINPVLKLNLVEQDLREGPWAMSIAPMEFAKKFKLLRENPPDSTIKSFRDRQRITVSVLRGEATRVFITQLGPFWRGPEVLPIHTRALFAVFAARANHDLAAADKLLKQISLSTLQDELDFSGTDELLNKYKSTKVVTELAQKHGYVYTVMATMLQEARVDGVLPVADFLWLKPVDRTLWFLLNNIGRQTAFLEIAGVIAHWIAEQEIAHRLYVPVVTAAVDGLEWAIADILYHRDEGQDGTEQDNLQEDDLVA